MKNRQSGVTLLELLIVMGIFVIVIAGASQMFVSLLSVFKQQSKITVTNIEGILGLEMMRRDIENAGYGLPWAGLTNYQELTNPVGELYNPAQFNDAPTGPPRAVLSGNGTGWQGTDRLVVKAINVAMNSTSEHWNFLYTSPAVSTNIWTPAADNLLATDRIIVISQDADNRTLVPYGGGFSNTFSNVAGFSASRSDPSIVYGVDPNTPLKMPFNRADYYVQPPATASDLPAYCAAGTGILYKAVIAHNSTGFLAPQQLLECVADMQVAFMYDVNGDGTFMQYYEDISGIAMYPANTIRNQVKEVRVYILAQEGQRDRNYTYPNPTPQVGETGIGRAFSFAGASITDWSHYRWKLYTLVVRPSNLQ
jgi:prepilin-type N-terminal cleavage/methylation domain-containing protein